MSAQTVLGRAVAGRSPDSPPTAQEDQPSARFLSPDDAHF